MSGKHDDGGTAFPVPNYIKSFGTGMSLRDYFAAMAMQVAATNTVGAEDFTFAQRAEWAYMQADAMLKERNL